MRRGAISRKHTISYRRDDRQVSRRPSSGSPAAFEGCPSAGGQSGGSNATIDVAQAQPHKDACASTKMPRGASPSRRVSQPQRQSRTAGGTDGAAAPRRTTERKEDDRAATVLQKRQRRRRATNDVEARRRRRDEEAAARRRRRDEEAAPAPAPAPPRHLAFDPRQLPASLRPSLAEVAGGALTKLHGAFKVQFPCAQRVESVLLNISAKFWRISSPDRRAVGYRARGLAAGRVHGQRVRVEHSVGVRRSS